MASRDNTDPTYLLCPPKFPTQLVPLPRTPSVATILAEYENSIATAAKPPRSLSLTREVVSGLKLYFDKSLGNNLLYRFERNQYAEIKKKYATLAVGQPMPVESTGGDKGNSEKKLKEMSEIYGVEHLLRLFGECVRRVVHEHGRSWRSECTPQSR